MYDVKFKYFYIKHDFFNAFNTTYINFTSQMWIKFNVSVYK